MIFTFTIIRCYHYIQIPIYKKSMYQLHIYTNGHLHNYHGKIDTVILTTCKLINTAEPYTVGVRILRPLGFYNCLLYNISIYLLLK